MAYHWKRKLTLIQHKIALEHSHPESSCDLKRNVLTWRASMRPTALSDAYKVVISYDEHHTPRIFVQGQTLRGLSKSDFPHKYEIDKKNNRVRVCLYLPSELDYGKPFSETLVPWTAEWLFHYEIWLATGDWRGGGCHPQSDSKKQRVDGGKL